jgi:hypothetical protein
VSFDLAARMLEDVLPTDTHVCATSIRNHLQRVAKRAEAGLGEEQFPFIDGCPQEWAALPQPPAPLNVGIDGGYVRKWDDKKTHFEVIVGKSIPEEGASKCFGLIQSYDDKPKRRLFEVLKGQGMQLNQQIVFFSDGGDNVRNLQLYLNPEAEHLLDWFHVTMRLTVLHQTAKGLPMTFDEDDQKYELREPTVKAIESIKWYLWHGNTKHSSTWKPWRWIWMAPMRRIKTRSCASCCEQLRNSTRTLPTIRRSSPTTANAIARETESAQALSNLR